MPCPCRAGVNKHLCRQLLLCLAALHETPSHVASGQLGPRAHVLPSS